MASLSPTKDKTIKLKDGRSLGYLDFGNPEGKPVFFFHGTPGSRLYRHPDCHSIATSLGVYLINVDRPGYGLSDPDPGRTLLDWADDIVELADYLNIKNFAVIGLSGGGPYVLSTSYKIPHRVTSGTLISGYINQFVAPESTEGMSFFNKAGFWIAKNVPFILPFLINNIFAKGIKNDPQKVLNNTAKSYAIPDQKIMNRPKVRKIIIEDMNEFYRKGLDGHISDLRTVVKPWGFKLQDVKTKINIWQGVKDKNVPIAMGKYLEENLPNCEASFYPNEGHLLFFNHWEEILSNII